MGDQVRLKALLPNKRALYTVGGTASCYIRNNSEPIRGELKHKRNNKNQGNNSELIIAETQLKQVRRDL